MRNEVLADLLCLKSRSVAEMGFRGRGGLASVFIKLILSASSLEKVIRSF